MTKGRSYVVSATMATQTLGIVAEKAGEGLVQNLRSNARNVIVYPGASETDADYFMKRFGTVESFKVKTTISKEVDRYKIDEIKTQLGLNDAPRESIVEDNREVDRFTKGQIMFGPNYRRRGIGNNDAFGFIYYMVIIKNSPQPPSVAKINYIPRDLKELSDKLVAAYDQTNRLRDSDEDTILDNESQVDPFKKEKQFKEESLTTLSTGFNNSSESDPMALSRNLNGSILSSDNSDNNMKLDLPALEKVDLSSTVPQGMPDFNNLGDEIKNLPEIESPAIPDLNFDLETPDFTSLDIKI